MDCKKRRTVRNLSKKDGKTIEKIKKKFYNVFIFKKYTLRRDSYEKV